MIQINHIHAEDINMDISFNAKQSEFKNFMSLIPGIYSEQFKDVQSKGKLAFKGFVPQHSFYL